MTTTLSPTTDAGDLSPAWHDQPTGLRTILSDTLVFTRRHVEALQPAIEVVHGADEVAVDEHLGVARLDLDACRAAVVVVAAVRIGVGVLRVKEGIAAVPVVPAGVAAIEPERRGVVVRTVIVVIVRPRRHIHDGAWSGPADDTALRRGFSRHDQRRGEHCCQNDEPHDSLHLDLPTRQAPT